MLSDVNKGRVKLKEKIQTKNQEKVNYAFTKTEMRIYIQFAWEMCEYFTFQS